MRYPRYITLSRKNIFSSKRKEFYKLCFFCPPNKVNYWMDYWTRKRLSWWKKYADIPAGFSLTDEDCREHFYQNCDEDLSDTTAVQVRYLRLASSLPLELGGGGVHRQEIGSRGAN